MNAQKFTQKSLEAIEFSEKTVAENAHTNIEPIHML